MTGRFYKEVDSIYRLRVPFEELYTSVFLIRTDEGCVLVDCGSSDEDVDKVIIPALGEAGVSLADIKALVITHQHRDHSGGAERLLSLVPWACVVRESREVAEGICTCPMAGHTDDSIGVLDLRTRTLISGDSLQGAGVGKYRCMVKSPDAYLHTVRWVMGNREIDNILFSHAYEPWNSDRAIGREATDTCLTACIQHFFARQQT